MKERTAAQDRIRDRLVRVATLEEVLLISGRFRVEYRNPRTGDHWIDEGHNLVVTEGRNYLLDTGFNSGAAAANWFLGLIGGTPTIAPGDTLASHAGWTEVTAYAGDRKAWGQGAAAAGEITNASPAVFIINADDITYGGVFACSAATGSTGVLYGARARTGGDRVMDTDGEVRVTYTASLTTPA